MNAASNRLGSVPRRCVEVDIIRTIGVGDDEGWINPHPSIDKTMDGRSALTLLVVRRYNTERSAGGGGGLIRASSLSEMISYEAPGLIDVGDTMHMPYLAVIHATYHDILPQFGLQEPVGKKKEPACRCQYSARRPMVSERERERDLYLSRGRTTVRVYMARFLSIKKRAKAIPHASGPIGPTMRPRTG